MKNIRVNESDLVKTIRSMIGKSIIEIAVIEGDVVSNISVYDEIGVLSISPITIKKIIGLIKRGSYNVDRYGNLFIRYNGVMYVMNRFTSPHIGESFVYYCKYSIMNEYSNTHPYDVKEEEFRQNLEEQFAFLD